MLAHYFFITYGGNYFGFYPNGLTIKQWAFSLGLSMIVWVVGFLVKLMPSSHTDKNKESNLMPNKSYNLSIKTMVTRSELSDF